MAFVFIAICVFVIMMITQVAVSTLLVPQAMATRQSLPTVIYVQINFAPDLPEQVGEQDNEYEAKNPAQHQCKKLSAVHHDRCKDWPNLRAIAYCCDDCCIRLKFCIIFVTCKCAIFFIVMCSHLPGDGT